MISLTIKWLVSVKMVIASPQKVFSNTAKKLFLFGMMNLSNQVSEKRVRYGIWKLRAHTFQPQYLLSDHLSILKWFWLISVPNELRLPKTKNLNTTSDLQSWDAVLNFVKLFWRNRLPEHNSESLNEKPTSWAPF